MGTVACTCCTNRKEDKLLADKLMSSPGNIRYRKQRNRSNVEKSITAIKLEEEVVDLRTADCTEKNNSGGSSPHLSDEITKETEPQEDKITIQSSDRFTFQDEEPL